jgi:O-antigen/teichoic acid export membrane protein
MPAIFAQTRSGGDLKRLYLNAIELIAAIQWPFLIFLALMADPIIRIWLGVSWIEIVPLVRMLCIASLSLFAACLTYPVLVAVGRVNEALTSSLISLPPSLLLIFVASFFGIQAVAASALLTLPFQAAVAIYFVSGHLKVSRSDLVDATLKSGVVTICSSAGIIVSAVLAQNGLIGPIVELILAGVLAAAGWLVGLIMTRHPLLARVQSAAVGLLDLVRRMRSDRIRNLRDETLRLN